MSDQNDNRLVPALMSALGRSRAFSPFAELARAWKGRHPYRTPAGWVRFGSLRRLTPLSGNWGFDRGGPIDRYYIEKFLERHRGDVRGRVLEVGADRYASRLGASRIERLDILDVDAANPAATIVADLAMSEALPADTFDCIVVTQTLQLVFDARSAVRTIVRALAPGGTALITVPGITPIEPGESGNRWYWSYTPLSMRELLLPYRGHVSATMETHGNVLAAAGFLYGISSRELRVTELDYVDEAYPVTICVRAVKDAADAS